MIRRYEVRLYRPDTTGHCWHRCAVRRFRTITRATRAAERMLATHPSRETRARPERWPWYAGVYDMKCHARAGGRPLAVVDAPVVLEPSVGELGYW